MTDIVFYGGLQGALFANQQFTMRNMTFYNAVTAMNVVFDWDGPSNRSLSIIAVLASICHLRPY
jgi:glucan 1,3-beta-glucosidase